MDRQFNDSQSELWNNSHKDGDILAWLNSPYSNTGFGFIIGVLVILWILEFGVSVNTITAILKRGQFRQTTEVIVAVLSIKDMAESTYWLAYGLSLTFSPALFLQLDFIMSNNIIQDFLATFGCQLLLVSAIERYRKMNRRSTMWTNYIICMVIAFVSSVVVSAISFAINMDNKKRQSSIVFLCCFNISTYMLALGIVIRSLVRTRAIVHTNLSFAQRREMQSAKFMSAVTALDCFLYLTVVTSSLLNEKISLEYSFYSVLGKAVMLPLLNNKTLFFVTFSRRFRSLWARIHCDVSPQFQNSENDWLRRQSTMTSRHATMLRVGDEMPGMNQARATLELQPKSRSENRTSNDLETSSEITQRMTEHKTAVVKETDEIEAEAANSRGSSKQSDKLQKDIPVNQLFKSKICVKKCGKNQRTVSNTLFEVSAKYFKPINKPRRSSCPELRANINIDCEALHSNRGTSRTIAGRPRSISAVRRAWSSRATSHTDSTERKRTYNSLFEDSSSHQGLTVRSSRSINSSRGRNSRFLNSSKFSSLGSHTSSLRDFSTGSSFDSNDFQRFSIRTASSQTHSQRDTSISSGRSTDSNHIKFTPWATRVKNKSLTSIMEVGQSDINPRQFISPNEMYLSSITTDERSPSSKLSSELSIKDRCDTAATGSFSFTSMIQSDKKSEKIESVHGKDNLIHINRSGSCPALGDEIDPVSDVYLGQIKDEIDPVSFVYLGPAK